MNSATISKIGMPASMADSPIDSFHDDSRQPVTCPSACGQCTRRCCAEYTVAVTGSDVWKIATSLRMAPEQFLIYFRVKDTHEEGFELDQSGVTYNLALDKAPGEGKRQPCIFWMELPGGFGRCGIYSCRPRVCQTYPAYIDGDVVSLRGDVLCPAGTWKLSQMNLSLWRNLFYNFRIEKDIYQYVVACWNHRVDQTKPGCQLHILDYYAFLMNIYPFLGSVMETVPEKEWKRILQCWGTYQNGEVPPLNQDTKSFPNGVPDAWLHLMGKIRNVVDGFYSSIVKNEYTSRRESHIEDESAPAITGEALTAVQG